MARLNKPKAVVTILGQAKIDAKAEIAAKNLTGATVYVPLFVEEGEKIVIDTRTGEYSKRV